MWMWMAKKDGSLPMFFGLWQMMSSTLLERAPHQRCSPTKHLSTRVMQRMKKVRFWCLISEVINLVVMLFFQCSFMTKQRQGTDRASGLLSRSAHLLSGRAIEWIWIYCLLSMLQNKIFISSINHLLSHLEKSLYHNSQNSCQVIALRIELTRSL